MARRPSGVLIAAGWALAFIGLLALLDFHPIVKMKWYPHPTVLPTWLVFLLLGVGMAGMTVGFRGLPVRDAPDLTRRSAWILLALIGAAGAFLRLYQYDLPPAPFWDDWADGIVWENIVRDKDRFYWMFPTDGREPFLPYVMIALMELLPESVRDFVIKRLAGALVDLAAIWLMYRAGRELGGRRAGLAAAALVAFSRPTLQLTLTGMRAFTLTLAVAFLAFATLRLLKKPKLRYFALWGFALAFGVHTYSSYRTFMLAVPFLLLPWVLIKSMRKRSDPAGWAAAVASIPILLGVYSGTLAATFPAFTPWRDGWESLASHPWMAGGLLLACVAGSLAAFLSARRRGRPVGLAGWGLAVSISSALIFPISRSVGFTERLSGLSPFHREGHAENPVLFIAEQAWRTLRALFYYCVDRNDLLIAADPFFDLFSQGALALGLAFLLSRWDLRKALLLALGVLGTSVYILSFDPASTKLAASAPPLFLLAGWAVSRLFGALPAPSRKRTVTLSTLLLSIFLAGYGVFGAILQFQKLHGYWARFEGVHTDTSLAQQVWAHEANHRVYLAPADWFFGWNSQCVLNEGKRFYILKETNSIPETAQTEDQDILVLVFGADSATQAILRRDHPSARWEKVPLNPARAAQDPNPELYIWRVAIPFSDLSENPQALLYRRVGKGPWLRRYYNPIYGWRLSGILREARVEGFSDPLPMEELKTKKFERYNHAKLVQITGNFEVPEDGTYEWRSFFTDPVWIRIDGRDYWKRDTGRGGGEVSFRASLKKGTHPMEARIRLVHQEKMPEITWRRKGEEAWRPFEGARSPEGKDP